MKNRSLGTYNLIDEEGIKKSVERVLASDHSFHTYATPKGLKELRMQISTFLKSIGDQMGSYHDMLITSGSQQSINLAVYSLLKEGDSVLIEQPTYFGAMKVFEKKKVNLIGVDIQEEGINLKSLEEKIRKYHPKLIYVTPTFHNPTGYSWSEENRKEFLKIINQYDILVMEDDPYRLLNFTNICYKSLYELNQGKNVIYLGTFSKYISPSVNVGYILAQEDILRTIYSFKESFDLCTSLFLQYIVLDYLKNNDLLKIIKKRMVIYKKLLKKAEAFLEKEYKNNFLSYSKPKGGLFFHILFKQEVDHQVFEDGNRYYIDQNHDVETRINICSFLDEI